MDGVLGGTRWNQFLWELKFYGDLGLDGDGLIVEVVRLVFPLLDGVDGGAGENRVATDQLHTGNAAVFANAGQKLDGALDAHLPGLWRIDRVDGLDQKSLRYSLRYFEFLRGLLRQRRRRGAHDSRDCLIIVIGVRSHGQGGRSRDLG